MERMVAFIGKKGKVKTRREITADLGTKVEDKYGKDNQGTTEK